MKKKMFLGAGAAVLVVAAAFASKAKFAGVGIYYTAAGQCNKLDATAAFSGNIVTVAPSGATTVTQVLTKAGGKLHLYITSACHNVTYFIP
jgi:hypothetical protein